MISFSGHHRSAPIVRSCLSPNDRPVEGRGERRPDEHGHDEDDERRHEGEYEFETHDRRRVMICLVYLLKLDRYEGGCRGWMWNEDKVADLADRSRVTNWDVTAGRRAAISLSTI